MSEKKCSKYRKKQDIIEYFDSLIKEDTKRQEKKP